MSRRLAALGLFTAACATVWSGSSPRTTRRDRIRVPHARHAAAQVECIACHEAVYDATSLEVSARPPEEKCLECHRAEKEQGNCRFCHTDPASAGPWPAREPHLRLSHAKHIELVEEDCSRCHASLPEPGASGPFTPAMAACLSCHPHQRDYDEGGCERCHIDLSRFPLLPVSVFSHQGDFVRAHPRAARTAAGTCARCHEQTFCGDCHRATAGVRVEEVFPERVDRDFIHRGDYLTLHTLEAGRSPATCRRCHGESFCTGCHSLQNLTPMGTDPRDPHPPGWSFPGSASFHGDAARRDITSCAACHEDGPRSICIDCHRVGGVGGNPHPTSWLRHHPREEIQGNGMCLYCHL